MSGTKRQSLSRRLMRHVTRISLTLVIAAGAIGAVIVGSGFLQSRAAAVAMPDAAEPVGVSVEAVTFLSGYTRTRQFIGQVEPANQIALAFELGGRMVERPVQEGETVEAGQVIARLDIELLQAERDRLVASRDALSAQFGFADRQLERSAALRKQGFSSVAREDEARAARDELQNRIIETEAALAAVDIRLEKSVLRAPRAGQVGELFADPGSTLDAGQPVLSLIEKTAPRLRVGVPVDLDPAMLEAVEVQIGDSVHAARLLHLRPDIDPATRTRTAIFALTAEQAPVFGRTARLLLDADIAARGAWVPIDALREGDGGVWTVLIADDGTVRSAAVEVLHAQADRAFVTGSFEEGALLIERGAHRLVPGQRVRTLDEGQ